MNSGEENNNWGIHGICSLKHLNWVFTQVHSSAFSSSTNISLEGNIRLEGNWQWQHHTQQRLPPPVHSLQPSSKTRFWTWDLNFQYFYHSPTSLIHCTFVLDQLLFNLKPKQLSSFEDMVGKTLAHDKIPVKASPKNPTASLSLESKQS